MSINKKFESICVDFSAKNNAVFDVNNNNDNIFAFEYENTCIISNSMTLYGIPFDLSETQMNKIYEKNYENAVKIGEIDGCLILCKQMISEGYDPWEICDDSDADLEYTISALKDEGGPLNFDRGDPYQDVYYIHKFKMEKGYEDVTLKSRIIEKLPDLILSFLHVAPDILSFYPESLESVRDEEERKRHEMLRNIAADKINLFHEGITGEKVLKEKDGNVVNIKSIYQFTEDEINIIMGRRNSDSSYPEQAKDQNEFAFYEENGFKEVGNSRLLFKNVSI